MYNDRHRDSTRPSTSYGRSDERPRRGVPLSDLDPALTEVSRKVIGASIEVHKALGPGFSEETYLSALRVELEAQGVAFSPKHTFAVKYRDQKVGERTADLFVDGKFLVEVMAVHGEIGSLERAVMRSALKCSDLELGLIINFAERRLKDGLVRVLNPEKIKSLRGSEEGEAHDEGGFDDEPRGA
jgi:GxxExxY protein